MSSLTISPFWVFPTLESDLFWILSVRVHSRQPSTVGEHGDSKSSVTHGAVLSSVLGVSATADLCLLTSILGLGVKSVVILARAAVVCSVLEKVLVGILNTDRERMVEMRKDVWEKVVRVERRVYRRLGDDERRPGGGGVEWRRMWRPPLSRSMPRVITPTACPASLPESAPPAGCHGALRRIRREGVEVMHLGYDYARRWMIQLSAPAEPRGTVQRTALVSVSSSPPIACVRTGARSP